MRSFRIRSLSSLVAALAVAAILVPIGSSKTRDACARASPTIYVQYTMNCTFSFVDDSGKPDHVDRARHLPGRGHRRRSCSSSSTRLGIDASPGDFTGCRGWVQFQMTGPGVNLSTTLDTGCDSNYLLPGDDLQGRPTYNAVDLNQPSVAHASSPS